MKDLATQDDGKISTGWPERVSKPDFSVHINGYCVFSGAASPEELVMTVCVRKNGLQGVLAKDGGKVTAEHLVSRLGEKIRAQELMYMIETAQQTNPKPMGKKPRGA